MKNKLVVNYGKLKHFRTDRGELNNLGQNETAMLSNKNWVISWCQISAQTRIWNETVKTKFLFGSLFFFLFFFKAFFFRNLSESDASQMSCKTSPLAAHPKTNFRFFFSILLSRQNAPPFPHFRRQEILVMCFTLFY